MTQFGYQPSLNSKFFPPVQNIVRATIPSKRTPEEKATIRARREEKTRRFDVAMRTAQCRRIAVKDGRSPVPVVIAKIIAEVSAARGVSVANILSNCRERRMVAPRYEAMYRARAETTLSMAQIGRAFGRDHSTIHHAIRQHAQTFRRKRDG